jgi:peptidyl-prolyl cis-trans isomerase A (cyclophilin A)
MYRKQIWPCTLFLTLVVGFISSQSGCVAGNRVNNFDLSKLNPKANAKAINVGGHNPALMKPELATAKAPATFDAKFETTKGDFTITVHRDWAPHAADRFYNMVEVGYFDSDIAIFRAIDGFMFQFGIHGDPEVNAAWRNSTIPDDPSTGKKNAPGTLSFAQTGNPNSRSVQMFCNLGLNTMLDSEQPGGGSPFVPFAQIKTGASVLKKINTEYGENPKNENVQKQFKKQGNEYILDRFKNIDLIKSVTILETPTVNTVGSDGITPNLPEIH